MPAPGISSSGDVSAVPLSPGPDGGGRARGGGGDRSAACGVSH